MSNINIKKIREKLHISQEKLAETIGVSIRTVQNWESGSKIPASKSAILHNLLSTTNKCDDTTEQNNLPNKLIPFFDEVATVGGIAYSTANMQAPAGQPELVDAGDWFREATAAIRHYGESMIEYPSGCILAIKEVYDRSLIIPGRNYVIETSEYRVTKRVQRGSNSNHITAYSTNTETYPDGRLVHEPFEIAWQSVSRISLVLGCVVRSNNGTLVCNG